MYEFPKIKVEAELTLVNGESINGSLFVTDDLVSAEGNPRIEEYLNDDPDTFFSFQVADGGYRLINKAHLVSARVGQDDAETRHQTPLSPRELTLHLATGDAVSGAVYPTLMEETRVSDIINQEEAFLVLFQDGKKLVINREQIISVSELDG